MNSFPPGPTDVTTSNGRCICAFCKSSLVSQFKMSRVQWMHRCSEIESHNFVEFVTLSISLTVQWDLSSVFGPTTIASLKVKILQEHV